MAKDTEGGVGSPPLRSSRFQDVELRNDVGFARFDWVGLDRMRTNEVGNAHLDLVRCGCAEVDEVGIAYSDLNGGGVKGQTRLDMLV